MSGSVLTENHCQNIVWMRQFPRDPLGVTVGLSYIKKCVGKRESSHSRAKWSHSLPCMDGMYRWWHRDVCIRYAQTEECRVGEDGPKCGRLIRWAKYEVMECGCDTSYSSLHSVGFLCSRMMLKWDGCVVKYRRHVNFLSMVMWNVDKVVQYRFRLSHSRAPVSLQKA